MPAEIVNLRRVRKAKVRNIREETAAENRRLHGRTKAEKAKEAAERERAVRAIDAHRRDDNR
jgi:hypothetical protein